MRVFLIPLSKVSRTMHCQSSLPVSAKVSYVNKGTAWAAKKWQELGESKPDTSKGKLYRAGSRLLDKMEHEEYFLKNVPSKEDWDQANPPKRVPFIHPSNISEAKAKSDITELIKTRMPYHRKYMILSAIWVPITSLFAIVPVVPNIPLFYNLFRLWSHWKAYNGAKHMDFLLKNNSFSYEPNDILNLGLKHDPYFSVFFNPSYLPKKHAQIVLNEKKSTTTSSQSTGTSSSINFESEIKTASESSSEELKSPLHAKPILLPRTSPPNPVSSSGPFMYKISSKSSESIDKKKESLSELDIILHQGFITEDEIKMIANTFNDPPLVGEVLRARIQEAEKIRKLIHRQGRQNVSEPPSNQL